MRPWMFALVGLSLAACSGSDAWAPEQLSGSYALLAVDGEPAPAPLSDDAQTRIVFDATLVVTGDHWRIDYQSWMIAKATADTTPLAADRLAVGSFTGSDPASLVFTGTGAGLTNFSGPGVFDPTTGILRLTISGSGFGSVFEFLKQ
jgi:hypothetical protein